MVTQRAARAISHAAPLALPVADGGGTPLSSAADVVDIDAALLRDGVLVLRGFADAEAHFDRLTDRFGRAHPANIRRSTARTFTSDSGTQAVTSGHDAVALHAESYFTPICPQVLAFLCVEHTAEGGETLVCDGAALVDALPAGVRSALLDAEITWTHRCPIDELEAQTQRSLDDFLAACADVDRCSVEVHATSGEVTICHTAPVVRTTWRGGRRAFANNLIPIAHSGLLGTMAPAVGAAVADEVERRAGELAVAHEWQAGDIVLLDNTRMMHGRTAWSGGVRRLRVRMLRAR